MILTKCIVLIIFSIIFRTAWKERNFTNINRPNFIFILTDDQDVELGGVTPLMKTRKLLSDKGATFKNMFVTTPLCCPSRSSILSGLYTHNHGVVNNSIHGNCSSKLWQSTFEKRTFITYLKKENYITFYAGKYLNQYGFKNSGGVSHIPHGWDNWIGLVGNSKYYNYTLSVNGKPEYHGDNSSDYLTTVMTAKASKFLQSYKPSQGPFFMMLAPPSPHKPYTPEAKYHKRFNNKYAPRTPNFNIHAKDKHWLIRQPPNPLPERVIQYIDHIFRERWRTLLTVDDMVEKLVNILKENFMLSNTYIIFSSDNGFHLGQFSLPEDKRQLYEFDIRVPLIIRGPGIKPKLELMEPVLNIDFAPTFMELAGIKIPKNNMDGTSFASLLYEKPKVWRNHFFIEHKGEAVKEIKGCPQYFNVGVNTCEVECICEDSWNNTYSCLRTVSLEQNTICCIFKDNKGFIESYNLTVDPYQLNNAGEKFCSKNQSVNKYLQHILNLIS